MSWFIKKRGQFLHDIPNDMPEFVTDPTKATSWTSQGAANTFLAALRRRYPPTTGAPPALLTVEEIPDAP